MVSRLEMQIDEAEAQLPRLRNFILPGGSELSGGGCTRPAICRRAERLLVDYASTGRSP